MRQPVGFMMKQITDKIKASADASFQPRELTLSQVRVLEYVSDRGGRVTQKSIEDYLDVTHPTVVGIVSRMEKKGYLLCYADQEDKRNKIVELTEKAVQISREMQNEIAGKEKELLQGLTEEEVKSLQRMLNIIYKNLS